MQFTQFGDVLLR